VPILGVTQSGLLPGDYHWVIQALHLAVGLGAIGLAEELARRIKRRVSVTPVGDTRAAVAG
jgi:hypothetical protein